MAKSEGAGHSEVKLTSALQMIDPDARLPLTALRLNRSSSAFVAAHMTPASVSGSFATRVLSTGTSSAVGHKNASAALQTCPVQPEEQTS